MRDWFRYSVTGWIKALSSMPSWARVLFVVACLGAMTLGIVVGLRPSINQAKIVGRCPELEANVHYYTSGLICAPYRRAYIRGGALLLDSAVPDCYCFAIPTGTKWVYVPSANK